MKTDPSHIIALLPGLLPDSYRSKLNFDEFYPQLNAKEQEDAIASLIDYLQFKRAEFLKQIEATTTNSNSNAAAASNNAFQLVPLIDGRPVLRTKSQILQIIDTTLLKCYLKSKENLVQFFLRRDANFLHLEESERLLVQHNKITELIILYEKKEAHEKALNLLLSESLKSNSSLAGYKHMVDYLKKLGNKHLPLIFKYAKVVLEAEPHFGMRVFMSGNLAKIDRVILKKSSVPKTEQRTGTGRKIDDYEAYVNATTRNQKKNSILNTMSGNDGAEQMKGNSKKRKFSNKIEYK